MGDRKLPGIDGGDLYNRIAYWSPNQTQGPPSKKIIIHLFAST